MSARLGVSAALTVITSFIGSVVIVAAVGGPVAAQDDTSTTSTTTSSTTSTTVEPTTTTTTTAAATTTTSAPAPSGGATAGAASVGATATPVLIGPGQATQSGQRLNNQLQLTPPPTPPPTTTLPPADALPGNSGAGRREVYSKSRQRVWTVEADGTVSKTHLVSGRLTWNQPLPGTYSVFSKSAYTCNIKNPSLCWRYMVRFTKGPDGDNIGFHEIPVNTKTGQPVQSIWQLGQALSGGCVRQAPADAIYMWNWAPVGTKVVVLA